MALKVRKSLQALFFVFESGFVVHTKKRSIETQKENASFTNSFIEENVPIIDSAKAIKKVDFRLKGNSLVAFSIFFA